MSGVAYYDWRGEYINQGTQDILVAMSPKECPEKLCAVLVNRGLSVTLVHDVEAALEKLKSHVGAFLLLDFKLNGAAAFLKKVISTFYAPPPYILVADYFVCSLAKADILNLGADACLDKPLDAEEVLAVINTVLRRADRLAHPRPLQTAARIDRGTLQIDPLCHNVIIDGKSVSLTAKEFEILHFLASHPDAVFSKRQIYERIWGEDYEFASTSVSDIISSLRKKLGLKAKEGRYIQTVHGVGYRFVNSK